MAVKKINYRNPAWQQEVINSEVGPQMFWTDQGLIRTSGLSRRRRVCGIKAYLFLCQASVSYEPLALHCLPEAHDLSSLNYLFMVHLTFIDYNILVKEFV